MSWGKKEGEKLKVDDDAYAMLPRSIFSTKLPSIVLAMPNPSVCPGAVPTGIWNGCVWDRALGMRALLGLWVHLAEGLGLCWSSGGMR